MIIVYGLSSSKDNVIRYIGQTKVLSHIRLKAHVREAFGNLKKDTHKCRWIRNVIEEGYQVLITTLKEDAIYNEDEKLFIKIYKEIGIKLVNATEGGDHAFELTQEARKKMSERKKGKKASLETKAKLSAMRKGRKQSPEWIAKRIQNRKKNGTYSHSIETKEKIRKKRALQKFNDDHKESIKLGIQASWDRRKNK